MSICFTFTFVALHYHSHAIVRANISPSFLIYKKILHIHALYVKLYVTYLTQFGVCRYSV